MASPQKENGHIDIANEIAEALARTNLNGYESRYLWVLWRKTYGWHKKDDTISNSQFSDATGINRTHIWRTEKTLLQRNIVTKLGNKLGFQKDYTQWRELPKMVAVTKLGTGVTYSGNKKLPKMVHTKETTKETIQKKEGKTPSEEAYDFFRGDEPYQELLTLFSQGRDAPTIKREFDKFTLYWTEKNKTGTRERWQTQDTFEVKRRLLKWMSNVTQFNPETKKAKVAFT